MINGKVWRFGDNVDTDVIMPGQYLSLENPQELASHCLEGLDPDFARKFSQGDVILAGKNFGCGSSREPATQAIKDLGVGCVIAQSFARIFLRNAIAIGLPVLELAEPSDLIAQGDLVKVDFASNMIINITNGHRVQFKEFPAFMQEIIDAGGLISYAKGEIAREKEVK